MPYCNRNSTNVKGQSHSKAINVLLDSADPSKVSQVVRDLVNGKTKAEAAIAVGVSRQQLYRYERGEAVPTLEELERLAVLADEEVHIYLNPKHPQIEHRVDAIEARLVLLQRLVELQHPGVHIDPESTQHDLQDSGEDQGAG